MTMGNRIKKGHNLLESGIQISVMSKTLSEHHLPSEARNISFMSSIFDKELIGG